MRYWVDDDHSYRDLVRLFNNRGGSFQHGLDEYRRRELLADWLKQQIDFGFFQVAELHPPPPLPPNPGAKAAKAIKEDVAPAKEKLGWFEVTVVDAWGKPVDGVELEVVYEGTRKKVTTPGNGKVKLPDIAASFGSARITNVKAVRDTLRPRWKDKYQPTELPEDAVNPEKLGLDATELTTSLESETPKTLVLVKPLTRIRLIGMHFDTNKCFLRPSAMNGIRQVVAVYKANPTGKLLILGHTDTTADDDYNLDLSVERAEAIKAYLKDDVAAWEAWFGEGKPKQKRWGDGEVAQMIKPLPCEQTVAGFQGWSNENKGTDLKVDGIVGPKTRKALIEAYMALDGTTLPEAIEAVTHGCGEFFPRTDEGDEFGKDGVAAEENRRVEMYCFDDQIFPPVPGPKASKGEPEYEQWKKQVTKTLDVDAAMKTISVRLLDRARAPMPNCRCRVSWGAASPSRLELSADADAIATLVVERSAMMLTIEWGESSGAELGDYMFVTQATIPIDDSETACAVRLGNMGFRLPDEPERIGVQRYQVRRGLHPTGSIADIRVELIDWHDTAKQPTAVV
ncbi:MAG: OmpA family protein [Myxococcales bacterium]|nr:OmpA family protein [Myxococcales bacterium]